MTLFVILGIALLVIVGLILLSVQPNRATTTKAQEERMVIQSAVEQCLIQVGESALRTIGQQGGYAVLTPPLKDAARGYSEDTQVVTFTPEKVPLWHEVQTSGGKMVLNNNRPPLCEERPCPVPDAIGPNSIQSAIEQLIDARMDTCLGNFSSSPQIQVERRGQPRSAAVIREDDIALQLNYPLRILTSDRQTVDLEEFSGSLDLRLPALYRYATKIQAAQRQTQFLENTFLHLLSLYQGIDSPLPPFREIQTGGSERTWTRSQVQATIEDEVLMFMSSFVQIVNAEESYVPLASPQADPKYAVYQAGVYDYLSIKIDNESYPYGTRLEYPQVPMYLSINEKEFLRPRGMPGGWLLKLVGMSIRDYRFKYTASFPMFVRIQDPAAFAGRGYDFTFGMEANIKNNLPLDVATPYVDVDFPQTSIDLSDESQLVNHTYRVAVLDARGGKPLAGAMVVYACGGEYALGETGEDGVWTGKLPYCASGGYIIGDAEGYLRQAVEQDNLLEDGKVSEPTVKLWPFATKTVRVFKRTETDVLSGARAPLAKEDGLVVQFQRQRQNPYEGDAPMEMVLQFGGQSADQIAQNALVDAVKAIEAAYQSGQLTEADYQSIIASLPPAQDSVPSQTMIISEQNVTLVPGRYDIEGSLMYDGLIQIPAESRGGFLGIGSGELPAQNFTTWPSGGISLVGADGAVLTPEQVYDDRVLVLYVLEQKIPSTWADIEKRVELETYLRYEREAQKPTLE